MALEALRPEGGPAFPPHLGMASTGRGGGVGAPVLLGRHQTPWGFEPQRDSEARWSECSCHVDVFQGLWILWGSWLFYPLVMSDIAIENGHRNSDFSHQTWWCSIVMWQFTRPGKCFSPVQYDLGSMGWDSHPWTWNTRYAKPPKIRETSMFLIQNCGFRHILPPQPNIFLSLQAYYEAHLGKESFPRNGLHKMNILHALETHAVFGGSQQLYFGTNVGSYHLELMGGSFKIILFKYRPRSWCVYIVHDCSIPLTIAFRTATRKGHLVEAASGSNSLQKHAAVKFHFAPQPTVEVTIMHPRKIIYHHLRSTAFSRLHQHETSSQFRIIYIYIWIYMS